MLKKIKSIFRKEPSPPPGYEPLSVKEMKFEQGNMTLTMSHPEVAFFTESMVKFFKDTNAVNYVTTSFWHPEEGYIEVIVQKKDMMTPSELHQELLMAVERKIPGETRHETALRYIREAENPTITGLYKNESR